MTDLVSRMTPQRKAIALSIVISLFLWLSIQRIFNAVETYNYQPTLYDISIWSVTCALCVFFWPEKWNTKDNLKWIKISAACIILFLGSFFGSGKIVESWISSEKKSLQKRLYYAEAKNNYYEQQMTSLRDSKSDEEMMTYAQLLKNMMKSQQEGKTSR
jgi:Na+/H+ antiporter NhaC